MNIKLFDGYLAVAVPFHAKMFSGDFLRSGAVVGSISNYVYFFGYGISSL